MSETREKRKLLYRIVTIGLMAALVYVGNYLQIKIPNGLLVTRIHLGNSMCLLAGLLFGPLSGGLSSGIGAMLFDLFDPVYIVSAPYTFISKFAMGFTAGLLNRYLREKSSEKALPYAAVSAAVGQIVYIFLYLLKSYLSIIILGGTSQEAWAAVGVNSITSSINAAAAVLISVPLYFSIKSALRQTTEISTLINEKYVPVGKRFKPVTAVLSVLVLVGAIYGTIDLSTANKKAAQKQAAAETVQTVQTGETSE